MNPLLKKPSMDPTEPANYHPISNLPLLGKVIERVAAKQLQASLDESCTLYPFQYTFHPGYGMQLVLVILIDDLHRHLGICLQEYLDLVSNLDSLCKKGGKEAKSGGGEEMSKATRWVHVCCCQLKLTTKYLTIASTISWSEIARQLRS